MLLNYTFRNYKSFKDDMDFSLEVKEKKYIRNKYLSNFVHFDNRCDVFKSAVIVGENAGGKTNFVESIKTLQDFFSENKLVKSSVLTINDSYKSEEGTDLENVIQVYGIEIYIQQKYYLYYLEIDNDGIYRELLQVKDTYASKYKNIFLIERKTERNDEDLQHKIIYSVELSSEYISKDIINISNHQKLDSIKLGLYITRLAFLGQMEANIVVNWVNNKLIISIPRFAGIEFYQDENIDENDLRIIKTQEFLDIFKMVDYSIDSIKVSHKKPLFETTIIRKNDNGDLTEHRLFNESTGVREFFAWAIQIYKVVYENAVLFADELDKAFNPILSNRVVSFINGSEHEGQFVFTTHNLMNLDLRLFMKGQMYFVNKKNLLSEIYSLADFKEVTYKKNNIYDFYMYGVLGGTNNE